MSYSSEYTTKENIIPGISIHFINYFNTLNMLSRNNNSDISMHESQSVEESAHSYNLIVFSHLRWDFVYQRPQQIISRLSQEYDVLFVEEPIQNEDNPLGFTMEMIHDNLTVVKPHVNSIEEIGPLLNQALLPGRRNIAWFYSAAFVDVLNHLDFDMIVYDCMDELSLFKNASEKIIHQEQQLLEQATIVFTGGKSLYAEKSKKHNNVHCFPSSVDRMHFKQSMNGIAVPTDLRHLQGTVVGYYGVIDERIDMELLYEVALQNPNIHFVMVGPLAKISETDLPKADNILFTGMKSYLELPAYLKRFDIAMMPFALNDSTKFISPTKTLEYMAAGKKIISTAIYDVVRDYSDVLSIVYDADEFSAAIKELIHVNPVFIYEKYQPVLARTSWDYTVLEMKNLIQQYKI